MTIQERCWACGFPVMDCSPVAFLCPNVDCFVYDCVGMTPDEFMAAARKDPHLLTWHLEARAARERYPERYHPDDLARYGIKPPTYNRPSRSEMREASIESMRLMLARLSENQSAG